jgi:hypothetical protein
MATSLPVADSKVQSPPRVVEAVGAASVGDADAMTSPTIIDVDPTSVVPRRAKDLLRGQPLIDLAPRGLGTSGT